MIKQHIFDSQNVPESLKYQILSFVRIEWPELFSGDQRSRDWTSKPEMHPVTMILEEEGVLISRLEVVWDILAHAGEATKQPLCSFYQKKANEEEAVLKTSLYMSEKVSGNRR